VATTLATLVVTAVLTVGVTRYRARGAAINEVTQLAPSVIDHLRVGLRRANAPGGTDTVTDQRQADLRAVLTSLRSVLGGASVDSFIVTTGPDPRIVDGDITIPVTASEISAVGVDADVVVIVRDGTAFGIAATELGPGRRLVIVAADDIGIDIGPLGRWFIVGSMVALAAAALVAVRLAKRISAPLAPVTAATAQIASGEFGTRVEPDHGWPVEMVGLAQAVNDMAGALQRSKGLEQQFLMSVSHDLRTPLTSIRGFAEALADGTAAADPKMTKHSAEVIVAQSRRLERLVKDLLELARLDARQFSLHMRATDVGHLISAASGGFAPVAAKHDLALSVDVEPGPSMTADIDPDRLSQVIANLVENATKYATSTVRLDVRRVAPIGGQQRVEVSVHDDGPGIADEDLPHVFERLYVAKREPVRHEVGSGLGLAIVSELVSMMGGSVSAHRSDLGGACLKVGFPVST